MLAGFVLAALVLAVGYLLGAFAVVTALFSVMWGALVAAIWFVLSLFASFLTFIGLGSVVTFISGVFAVFVAWLSTLLAFLTGPLWALFLQIYTWVLPLITKIAPFFTVGRGGLQLYRVSKWLRNKFGRS